MKKYDVDELIIGDARVVRCRKCGQTTVLRGTAQHYDAGCNFCLPDTTSGTGTSYYAAV